MCGICGEIRLDRNPASSRAVGAMAEVLAPRGPDGAGVFAQGRVALGHRRLKIIDLSEHAQQPMVDPDLGLTIVFNGCIYNYQELRAELEGMGYRFFSARRHRGDPQGLSRLGRRVRRPALRHVRLRDLGARQRPRRPGARPPRHQAALPRGDADGSAALRLDAAGAAGGAATSTPTIDRWRCTTT